MQFHVLLACFIGGLHYVEAAAKTYIYIDQIPIYKKLAPCAEDRVSAIVRAQASGCGDDTQLTSFACFCIDSSSEFSSIISTAVEDECSSAATAAVVTARRAAVATPVQNIRVRATVTPAPTSKGAVAANVASALEAFNSYCSKSTELSRFQQDATSHITQGVQTVYITTTPSASSEASAEHATAKTKPPVVAIVVPVVLILISIGVALWFFLRYRRQQRDFGNKLQELQADISLVKSQDTGKPFVFNDQRELPTEQRNEMYTAQHRAEMPSTGNQAVELDADAIRKSQIDHKLGVM